MSLEWSYLDVPSDVVLSSEVANQLTVCRGGRSEVGTDTSTAGLGMVVHKQLGGQISSLRTLGLEQGQVIGAWGQGREPEYPHKHAVTDFPVP